MNLAVMFFSAACTGMLIGFILNIPKLGNLVLLFSIVAVVYFSATDPTYWARETSWVWCEWIVHIIGLMTGYYSGKLLLEGMVEEWF